MSEEIARAVADTTVRSPAEQLATLHRMLRNGDETIRAQLVRIAEQEAATRQALAQLEAATADNATLCRLLGLDAAGHPGADLLADYLRLRQIADAADGYIRYGGAERWMALKRALDADVGQAGDTQAGGVAGIWRQGGGD